MDKFLGLVGIALTLIFAFLHNIALRLPEWLSVVGVGLGVLIFGIAVGLISSEAKQQKRKLPVSRALLRLRVFPDHRMPEKTFDENIFRWYYLVSSVQSYNPDNNIIQTNSVFTTLFVAFEPEVRVTNLKIRALEGDLPMHEVKEFNQRFAIIVFVGRPLVGTIEVVVEP